MDAVFFSDQNVDQILHIILRFFYDKNQVKVLDRIPMADLRAHVETVQGGMRAAQDQHAGATLQQLNLRCMSSLKQFITDTLKMGAGGALPAMPGSGELFSVGPGAPPSAGADSANALSSDDLLSEDDFQHKVRQLDALRSQVEAEVRSSSGQTFLCIQGQQREWTEFPSRTQFLFRGGPASDTSVQLVRVVLPVMAAATAPFLHVTIGGQECPLMWQGGSYVPLSPKMGGMVLKSGAGTEIRFSFPDGSPFVAGEDGVMVARAVSGQHHIGLFGKPRDLEEVRKGSRLILRHKRTGAETRHVVVEKRNGTRLTDEVLLLEPRATEEGEHTLLLLENQVILYFEIRRAYAA